MTTFLSILPNSPIGNYAELLVAINGFLGRNDLTDTELASFIALAEAEFNRVLRVPEMETVAVATATDAETDLPTDFLEMRSLVVSSPRARPLRGMSPVAMVEQYGASTGDPMAYCIVGSGPRRVRLAPTPTADVSLSMVYMARIEQLSDVTPTNWMLEQNPDIYLWGCLLAANLFIDDLEKLGVLSAAYEKGLAQLARAGINSRHGGAPLVPSAVAQVGGVRA